MAQFGRALRSGRRGRVFESRHPDQAQPEMAVLFYIGELYYQVQHLMKKIKSSYESLVE